MKFITLITYITYLLMCVYMYIPVYKLPRLEVILFLRFEAFLYMYQTIKLKMIVKSLHIRIHYIIL
jgi:hypothetical protein